MFKAIVAACTGLLISSCVVNTDGDIPFEKMSAVELAEYNEGRPLDQMIVCSDSTPAFSRVRRRHCATVEAMYDVGKQVRRLEVLNAGGSIIAQ